LSNAGIAHPIQQHQFSERYVAYTLPLAATMKSTICEHCDEPIRGKAYHVISEEDGVVLLSMIVCAPCAVEAKNLQLATREITAEQTRMAIVHQAAAPAAARLVAGKTLH
jgi:RNase P subunit RPR2